MLNLTYVEYKIDKLKGLETKTEIAMGYRTETVKSKNWEDVGQGVESLIKQDYKFWISNLLQ